MQKSYEHGTATHFGPESSGAAALTRGANNEHIYVAGNEFCRALEPHMRLSC